MRTIPCNPNAQPEVKEVLEYLSQIEGKGILTGQHTQTMEQPEIWRIEKLTGKLPAICGFELLSYSPNIRRETADEEWTRIPVHWKRHGNGQNVVDL